MTCGRVLLESYRLVNGSRQSATGNPEGVDQGCSTDVPQQQEEEVVMSIKNRIRDVLRGTNSGGKTQLLRHLRGERLTQRQAIIAKCYDCMAYCADGRRDCEMPHCALYPFMPYRKNTGEKLHLKDAVGSPCG